MSSRQYSPGNQTSGPTKSVQMSDPLSNSTHQLVQGYQTCAVNKPDQILTVNNSRKYRVNIKGDKYICSISSICETAFKVLLILDKENCKVKLLDQTNKVVAHCDLPNEPWSMCNIDSNLVAVTVENNHVHFIRVTKGQLIQDRILKLKIKCIGIAHQHSNLYITDGKALYHYTLDARLGRCIRLHEVIIQLAPRQIYVTNESSKQLVDRGGRQNNGVIRPIAVYYRRHTGSIVVGMFEHNDIRVFNAQ
ncbi:hypothetical protein DPMN_063302 [Dreissena polymorpha]|uniref:Uncharacterized protein n=1 Tax=Dreissena polymorpha TaxID=45954 RepID=A0A9D4CBD9_DREPO|nr:hypothetical protein DPMN_063302 [Dreissena polymorpha]